MSDSLLQLNSQSTSLVIKLKLAPEILYWGGRLMEMSDPSSLFKTQDRGVMQARLDVDVPVTLCPEIGRGSYGSSGIEGIEAEWIGRLSLTIKAIHTMAVKRDYLPR
ncbi:alpha-galactosidase [Vibrio sp. JCM 19236]|nr:alpha-galactosidase [Vibrio sp. JCM 19236]